MNPFLIFSVNLGCFLRSLRFGGSRWFYGAGLGVSLGGPLGHWLRCAGSSISGFAGRGEGGGFGGVRRGKGHFLVGRLGLSGGGGDGGTDSVGVRVGLSLGFGLGLEFGGGLNLGVGLMMGVLLVLLVFV